MKKQDLKDIIDVCLFEINWLRNKNKKLNNENKELKEQLNLCGVGKSKIKEDNYTKLIDTLEYYRKENVIVESFELNKGFIEAPSDFGFSQMLPNGQITITINLIQK